MKKKEATKQEALVERKEGISRRDVLIQAMAVTASLTLGGLLPELANAQGRPPRPKTTTPRQTRPTRPTTELKRAEVPRTQATMLRAQTLFPEDGRVERSGTTTAAVGNPERPNIPPPRRGSTNRNPNYNPDGSRKDRGSRPVPYEVELMIRTAVGDTGSRPLADMCFWESPDIWIEGPSGNPDVATPGQVNKVHVHVWNMGMAASHAAVVELYWCDPSVGIGPAAANKIGKEIISLMAGEHRVVTFNWTPTQENGGHECLVAQVYDVLKDHMVYPFNSMMDRHVAQRNVSVVSETSLAGSASLFKPLLEFGVPNLSTQGMSSTLEIEQVSGQAFQLVALGLGKTLQEAMTGTAALSAPSMQPLLVSAELLKLPGIAVFRNTLPERGIRADSRAVIAAMQKDEKRRAPPRRTTREAQSRETARMSTKQQLTVPGGREAKLELMVKRSGAMRRGEAQVFRVVERVGDKITGGVTVVIER